MSKLDPAAVIEVVKELSISNISLYKTHVPWGETADRCKTAAAQFTGAGLTIIGSGVIDLPNDEATVRKAFENARAGGLKVMVCKPSLDALPLVERFVKEFDQKLGIHNHGPGDKFYPSCDDAWKAVQPYDKRIGLCIDVAHTARTGTDPVASIRKYAERLYDIHLKDSVAPVGAERDVPMEIGRGNLDVRGMLSALIEINYPHVVTFEYEKKGVNSLAGLGESVGYVRGLLAGMAA
jgi:inosose dehydratase